MRRNEREDSANRRGDTLLGLAALGDEDAAVELLDEFFGGYPLEQLRFLLASEYAVAAKSGAWIASELGKRAAPLVDDLVRALAHPEKYVRFFAIDALLRGASTGHGAAVAAGITMIDDVDDGVRWKAMEFLAKATSNQLTLALPHLSAARLRELVRWSLVCDEASIVTRIEHGDAMERRVAAAAAGRIGLSGNSSTLLRLAKAKDPEVSRFAKDILEEMAA